MSSGFRAPMSFRRSVMSRFQSINVRLQSGPATSSKQLDEEEARGFLPAVSLRPGHSPITRIPAFGGAPGRSERPGSTRSVQLADRSQKFRGHPFALPVVEVGRLDIASQDVTEPQLPTIVPDRGESIRAAVVECDDTPPAVRRNTRSNAAVPGRVRYRSSRGCEVDRVR